MTTIQTELSKPRGRKRKYAAYDDLLSSIKGDISNRPVYLNGIGIAICKKSNSAWIKVKVTHNTIYKSKTRKAGSYLEIKLGRLESFSWEQLEALLKAYQGKLDRGEPIEDQTIATFTEYADIYMSRVNMVDAGRSNTERCLDKFLKPEFGVRSIDTITSQHIDLWQSRRLKDIKPASVQRQKVVLNAILNMALKDGIISVNPVTRSQSIRIPERRPRYLNREEIQNLLSHADKVNNWIGSFIMFGVYTGLRKGEVLKLTWQNVIFKSNGQVYLQFNSGKTNKVRIVPCVKQVIEILTKLKGKDTKDEDRIFPYSVTSLDRAWRDLKDISKIKNIRIHDLRVTCASYSANAGIPIKTLALIMGHSTTRMLEKHYIGVSESDIMRASKVIEKSFETVVIK